MKRPYLRAAAALAMAAGLLLRFPAAGDDSPDHADAVPNDSELVARGRYLAVLGDCAGCHTAPGAEPFAGGMPLLSPFGPIYATNITPDPQAGIGRYSLNDFEQALRAGIAKDGRRLYPAMPYPSFARVSDQDVRALYAYFMQTVAPVSRAAPPTRLPFPFDQRWALRFWDAVFAPKQRFQLKPDKGALWNRGAYIVQSLGHCGACHTPRGLALQERGYDEGSRHYLTGGINDNWFAPNLTGDPGAGLGRLSERDIVSFLKTGHGRGVGVAAFGGMGSVIENSTQHISKKDLQAIARYLKSLPPRNPSGAYVPSSADARQAGDKLLRGEDARPGAGAYMAFCARCHKADGRGEPQKFPALAGNPIVLAGNTASLIRLLIEGGATPRTRDGPRQRKMPAFGQQFTDIEIARVLTLVRSTWGNRAAAVAARDVARVRRALADRAR